MIMSDAFSYVNALDCAADASWRRQTLILNNLANEDTPGYKRKDIEFASVLKKELLGTRERTLDRAVDKLDDEGNHVDGFEYTDYETFSYRLDRNNVDPDTENVELASETLRYQAYTTSISNEFERFSIVCSK